MWRPALARCVAAPAPRRSSRQIVVTPDVGARGRLGWQGSRVARDEEVRPTLQQRQKRRDDPRIEIRARAALDVRGCLLAIERRLVGALGGKGVEGIGDGEKPCGDGYRVAGQAIRV